MRKNSRRANQQGKQVQKTLTPFTQGSPKMADGAGVNTQERTPDATPEATLSLRMPREELQISRETVLVQIKAEIATLFKEIKTDVVSLREETKADIQAIRDELAGELARLRSAQAETAHEYKEMATALSETMDRESALEKSQQLVSKEFIDRAHRCPAAEQR